MVNSPRFMVHGQPSKGGPEGGLMVQQKGHHMNFNIQIYSVTQIKFEY